MEPFFQHLTPATTDDAGGAGGVLSRLGELEDLDRLFSLQAGAGKIIVDPVSRRKVLARHWLPSGQVQVDTPERDEPSGLQTPIRDPRFTRQEMEVLADRLEESLTTAQAVPVLRRVSSIRQSSAMVTGSHTGVDITDFQVAWLGGNAWRVADGRLRRGQDEIHVPGRDLRGEGFIGFDLQMQPYRESIDPPFTAYTIQTGPVGIRATWSHNSPERSVTEDGVIWTAGSKFIPLAWVRSPSSSAPMVLRQIHAGVLRLPDRYDEYGVGGPIVLPAQPS